MKRLTLILASLAIFGALAIADPPDLSKLPPAAKKSGLTYAKDIRPIFEASCLRCHSGERPKAGLRLDSLESVLQGSRDGKVVMPGNSEKSLLVIAVARLDEEIAMPPKPRQGGFRGGPGGQGRPGASGGAQPGASGGATPGQPPGSDGSQFRGGPEGGRAMPKPLTTDEVSLIRAWVDQGAK